MAGDWSGDCTSYGLGLRRLRFPAEVISVAVRWYLRYGLSYRDVEELLAERGITVDHVTVYRWVQRFTPEFIEAPRPCRHAPGDRWFADETYVKVAGKWTYLYRAVDQYGQVIDVLLSMRRDLAAARRFFARALRAGTVPVEVTTDRAPAYPRVLDELVPSALHIVEQYANNPVEADHGRLKARLRPMRGLKRHRSARILAAGHAFVQNLRRGGGRSQAGLAPARFTSCARRTGPPRGCSRRISHTTASISALTWPGEDLGRRDRSIRPPRPPCSSGGPDRPACQCVKISQISITSNVLLAIGPPSLDGGMILTSR